MAKASLESLMQEVFKEDEEADLPRASWHWEGSEGCLNRRSYSENT